MGRLWTSQIALRSAESWAILCCAGIVLSMSLTRALAEAAPAPQDAIGPPQTPRASPVRSQSLSQLQNSVTPRAAASPSLAAGAIAIVVKPLDLGRIAPDAFADWDRAGH